MFTNTYAPITGGVERSIETFCADFKALGHQVLIITPTFPAHETSTEEVFRVPSVQNINGSQFSFRVPLPNLISDRIEAFAPDVLHSHQPFMLGDAALRAARQFDRPLVFTNHTLFERYVHLVPVDSEGVRRVARQLPIEYANLCDHVIAPTQGVAEILHERGLESPVSVVPTGIDTRRFTGGDRSGFRRRFGIPPGALVIGHLGRLIPEKNLDFLADALRPLLERHPQVHLLWVGDGDSRPVLEMHFQEQGYGERVSFTGNLSGTDLRDAYAAMDIFTFASRTDTQGIVLLEAQASGLPVVALHATGPKDVLRHGETGLLVPEDATPEEFAAAVNCLATDEDLRKSLSSRALEEVVAYDHLECAKRMLGVYEGLLATWDSKVEDLTGWDRFLGRAKAEWELLEEKATLARALFVPAPHEKTGTE